jgi:hypothetical protein
MPHRRGHRFHVPAWVRAAVYGVGGACLLSGAVWLYLHHFVRIEGEFGPEASGLEHPMLVLHGIAAAAMTWLFGLLWLAHVRRAWQARRNRRSGGTMVAVMSWLCVSGLGLYYIGNDAAREFVGNGHWLVGLFAALWLPIHIWRGRRAVRLAITSPTGIDSK